MTRWIALALIAVAVALFASAASESAVAKAVTMCGTVNIPTTKGKCRFTTVWRLGKRYKVRICLS